MMKEDSTQYCINTNLKIKLDALKVEKRTEILARYQTRKRFVTNTMVLQLLYDKYQEQERTNNNNRL